MNITLKMVKVEKEGETFPGSEGKTDEEWNKLGSVARYFAELRDALSLYKQEQMPDFIGAEA